MAICHSGVWGCGQYVCVGGVGVGGGRKINL